jgi:hypothetical protein
MMRNNFIFATIMVLASVAPASAVVCTALGFEGGIPNVVSTLTIDDGGGNTVDITDFSTTLITNSDPDNSSAVIVYDEFKFGSTAQAQISAAGLSMTTGTVIKGISGDLTAEVICD